MVPVEIVFHVFGGVLRGHQWKYGMEWSSLFLGSYWSLMDFSMRDVPMEEVVTTPRRDGGQAPGSGRTLVWDPYGHFRRTPVGPGIVWDGHGHNCRLKGVAAGTLQSERRDAQFFNSAEDTRTGHGNSGSGIHHQVPDQAIAVVRAPQGNTR